MVMPSHLLPLDSSPSVVQESDVSVAWVDDWDPLDSQMEATEENWMGDALIVL